MTIIEQTTVGKTSPATNEDGLLAGPDFVAVIDGSTSKTPIRIRPDMTNGRCCMLIVSDYIARMPAATTCFAFCDGVTQSIRHTYLSAHFDLHLLRDHPEQRTTASCIVYSRQRQEIWMVGDCQCLVDGVLYGDPKPQEARYARRRAEYIRNALRQGRTVADFQQHDEGRDLILPDIIDSCRQQNVDYSVFDGFPVNLDHVQVIDCRAAHEIVLASDGYPFLHPTLAESEAALAHLLRHDPLCIDLYPAAKGLMRGNISFDDRSYIRFTV